MSGRQKRRSISLSGAAYERVAAHCTEEGSSVSGWLEALALAEIDGPTSGLHGLGRVDNGRRPLAEAATAPGYPRTVGGADDSTRTADLMVALADEVAAQTTVSRSAEARLALLSEDVARLSDTVRAMDRRLERLAQGAG